MKNTVPNVMSAACLTVALVAGVGLATPKPTGKADPLPPVVILPTSCGAMVAYLKRGGAQDIQRKPASPIWLVGTTVYYWPSPQDTLYLFRISANRNNPADLGWLDCKKSIPQQIKANPKLLNLF